MQRITLWTRGAAALAAALLVVLLLAGCGSDGDSGATSGGEGVVGTVETMFGTITVPEPDDGELTVVALGWSDAEMALALGVKPVAVLDWQGFGEEDKGVGPWATDLFGDVQPEILTQTDGSVNYEQIQLLEPDLILNTRSGNDEKEFNRLSEIAPTVYAPTGTGAFATTWDVQLASVAAALGKSEEGETLAAELKDRIAETAEENPDLKGMTVASAAKFGDAYGAYLPGDGRLDVLTDLGLVNNPGIADLDANGFFATVPGEKVSVLDADVAVILPIGFTVADVENDKLLQSLDVVKDGRAVVIDPDSDLGGAWSASSVLSIPFVLDEIVPQLAEAAKKKA
ncbi:MAG: iron-siderophore ABC transporter substrate-binding protein [Thermoleophilia bacterium]